MRNNDKGAGEQTQFHAKYQNRSIGLTSSVFKVNS